MIRCPRTRDASRMALRVLTVVAGAAIAHGPVQADDGLGLPFPAHIAAVVPQGGVAGMQVSIAQFVSQVPAAQALASARASWSDTGRWALVDGEAGGWRTLSRHQGQAVVTLQIRDARQGGSVGLISRWTPVASPSVLAPIAAQLLPADAVAPRVTESRDPGAQAVSLVTGVNGTVDAVQRAIATRARHAGLTVAQPAPGQPRHAGSASMLLAGPGSEGAVTLVQRGGLVGIVIHLRERRS